VSRFERQALRVAVAIACLVPICAGSGGVVLGLRMMGSAPAGDLDSHFRYLSGLLLGIGLGYASTIPRIEAHGRRFRLLTGIVVVGGLGRLISLLSIGPPSRVMLAALAMELVITPSLALWQWRGARAAAEN
jgi:Domain of unknown function (DUF4345)